MKTKFILHGGNLKVENPHNDSFFAEVTRGLEDGDKVLFVGFARRDASDRKVIYERDKKYILAQTSKDVVVENAQLDTLIDQAKTAKVIYVTGGDTQGLQRDLEQYPGLINVVRGKTLAGSSAGACICATYYWGCTPEEVFEGFKWLPICLLVHYGNPEYNATDKELDTLKPYAKNLELVTLPECEWITREVDL